jgi:hypothetical protein
MASGSSSLAELGAGLRQERGVAPQRNEDVLVIFRFGRRLACRDL